MTTIVLDNPSASAADNVARIKAAVAQAYQAYMADPNKAQVTVQLGAGTWVVTGDKNNASAGAIELPSGIHLTGSGAHDTVIKLEDNFNGRINGLVRTALDTVENVTVSNLVLDGNRANNIGHQAGFICGIKEDGTGRTQTNITIDGVEAKNFTAYGINPHEVTYNMIVRNSVAHNNGLDGFVADAVRGGLYENNVSYDNDRHGFNIQNATQNLILLNNEAYDNGFRYMADGELSGGAGITIQRGDIAPDGSTTIPWVSGIQIIGGSYYNNGKEGVLVKLSEYVLVSDVDVYGNQRQGIRIEGSAFTTIQDSRIYNNSQEADNLYDEINIRLRVDPVTGLTYYATDTVITDSFIYSDGFINARWGIREEPTNDDGGPTRTVVFNNTIYGTDTGYISIPGLLNPVMGTNGDDRLGGLSDPIKGTAGADEMRGFDGNDTYTVNHTGDVVIEQAGQGADHVFSSVKFTLGANIENLTLTGTANLNGTGNDLNNAITGNSGSNTLKGGAGEDTLDGAGGNDSLDGGDGNDTYYVDSAGDIVVEKLNGGAGGIDTVFSSVSYVLPSQVENLTLLGSAHLNAAGNASANVLTGNSGNNILDGQGGADLMTGGAGNDTYYVNHTGDVVVEGSGGGNDTVYSSIAYTLSQFVENLILQGVAVVGAGNDLNNVIIGNGVGNKLFGYGGNDTLTGGLGNDTLDGGADTDTAVFSGKRADYTISGSLDSRTVAHGSQGTDTLLNVEILQFSDGRLVGDVWEPIPVNQVDQIVTRTGTSRSETLTGSDSINVTKGMGGNDVITGRGGNDSLYGGDGNDKVYGDTGNDRVYGDNGNDWVYGGSGDDRVYGGSGHDRLYGQGENDILSGGSGNDSIDGGAGSDRVYGDSGQDRIYGGLGDDRIHGGAGNDILYGNSGRDIFVFDTRLGNARTDRSVNFDTVMDFNPKYDSFWLDNAIFKKLGKGSASSPVQLNKEFFTVGSKAREKDDYLIYDKKTGILSYDADGSGSGQAVEFAKLSKGLALTYKDFFVV